MLRIKPITLMKKKYKFFDDSFREALKMQICNGIVNIVHILIAAKNKLFYLAFINL